MHDDVRVKICGLTRPEDVRGAVAAGAGYLGFVFYPKSPRDLSLASASALAGAVPPGIAKVALTVDAGNDALDALLAAVPIDILQLHGHESPERVREIKSRTGLPVMKAVGVADASDLPLLDVYASVADMVLVDAKPPTGSILPGGNGLSFDWTLIAGRRWSVPWMLAGGLDADNVREAIDRTGARQVDVSSGVECAPGSKDAVRMSAFVQSASGRL